MLPNGGRHDDKGLADEVNDPILEILFSPFFVFLKSDCASAHLNWDICLDNPGIDGSPAMPYII